MPFPETRHTLVARLLATNQEADWHQFMRDYWSPICRFAASFGSLPLADAEDVTSMTFEAVLTHRLLARWSVDRAVKLRTLLCSVARNIISNRARVDRSRTRILRMLADESCSNPTKDEGRGDIEGADCFYAAWADAILEQAVQALFDECYSAGRGDRFRILLGRICEGKSLAEISDTLRIPLTTVENHFKAARKRLARELEQAVREHVARYCPEVDFDDEWQTEWNRLGEFLTARGGLEECVRRVAAGRTLLADRERTAGLISLTISRIEPLESP